MSLPAPNMSVFWGTDNPVELVDIGTLASLKYEDSISDDAVATLTYVKCPLQVADRPELQGGQRLLISWGRGAVLSNPVTMVIEEPEVDYGAGIKMSIRLHDAGTDMKGIMRHRVWPLDNNLTDVVTKLGEAYGFVVDVQAYAGSFDRVQNRESDYKYLQRLANTIGYRFWIDDKTLRFRVDPIDAAEIGVPLVRFAYRGGAYLTRFKVRTERQEQKAAQESATAQGFDLKNRNVVTAEATQTTDRNTRLSPGTVTIDSETGVITEIPGAPATGNAVLTTEHEPDTVAQIAQGARQDSISSQQVAELGAPGFTILRSGKFIEMVNVADKHAGIFRIIRSSHTISGSGYPMRLTLDRETTGSTDGPDVGAVPSETVTQQEAATEDQYIIDAETGQVVLQ